MSGIGIVAFAAAGAAWAQLLTGGWTPWVATAAGSIALSAGMIMIVVAAATGSSVTYLAASILGGAGFGAAFLGGLRALVAAIPPLHRASVLSAFYVVAYGALSVPAVLAGVAVTYIRCSRRSRFPGPSSQRSRSSWHSKPGGTRPERTPAASPALRESTAQATC